MCLKGELIAEVPFKLFGGSHTQYMYIHTYIYGHQPGLGFNNCRRHSNI